MTGQLLRHLHHDASREKSQLNNKSNTHTHNKVPKKYISCVTRKVDSDEELRIIVKIGKCAGSFASCVNEEAEDGVAKSKLIYI